MISPKQLTQTHGQVTQEAIRKSSSRTGLGFVESIRQTPNWQRTQAHERGPGRPTNDSASIKHVTDPTLSAISALNRGGFSSDLSSRHLRNARLDEIKAGHDVDSILAQSTDKYTDLAVKEGFELLCPSKTPKTFIESRLGYIELATGIPWKNLIKESIRDYSKYGNAYWVKSRCKVPKIIVGGREVRVADKIHPYNRERSGPIGGYYRAQPRHMYPIYDDKTGKIIQWEQRVPGKDPKIHHLEDVIHFAYKAEAGEIIGTAQCSPVLEDIRTLRDIEEVVAKMLFKHTTPMIHHQVPDLVGDGHSTQEDVDNAASNWASSAPDGLLVTPEGHKITVLETKIGAIDASPYLKYFLQRALLGLNLSEAIMGIGNVGSGTSDMLTAQMHDRVKSFQNDFEEIIYLRVILELLIEANFNPIHRSQDRVYLRFTEIEIETEIKLQNFWEQQYMNGGITEDEFRVLCKKNPFTEEERKKLYLYTQKLPLIEEQTKLETKAQKDVVSHTSKLDMQTASHAATLQPSTTTVTKKTTAANKSGTTHTTTSTNPPKVGSVAASKGLSTTGNPSSSDGKGSQRKGANTNNPVNKHGSRGGPRMGPGSSTPADKR